MSDPAPRRRPPRATIVDVARAAGVSVTTVSHVLNSTRVVSKEATARVLDAVAEIGYRPNIGARALRTSLTQTVGVVMTVAGLPVLDEMVLGIEERASELGLLIMLSFSRDDREREWNAIHAFRDHAVDGLLVMPVSDTRLDSAHDFASLDVPVVLLDRPASAPTDQIRVANAEPVTRLTRHLVALGHSRLAFVSLGSNAVSLTERLQGFLQTAADRDLPDAVVIVEDDPEKLIARITASLRGPTPPTGFVSASQVSTLAFLEAVAASHLAVPDDVALVCFDDLPFADTFGPRLTSAVQPARELGRRAMSMLDERMTDPDLSPRSTLLSAEIRHRESCGCPPGSEFIG